MEDIIEETEELFRPRPGGMVDRHRHREAMRRAAEEDQRNVDERIEQPSYKAVKVAQLSPSVVVPVTYTIAAGGNAPVLPLGPYRFRATILVITAAGIVILAKDQGAAISQTGFSLPYGIPLTYQSRAQLYAYNPTAFTVQVSVISELYGPEQ